VSFSALLRLIGSHTHVEFQLFTFFCQNLEEYLHERAKKKKKAFLGLYWDTISRRRRVLGNSQYVLSSTVPNSLMYPRLFLKGIVDSVRNGSQVAVGRSTDLVDSYDEVAHWRRYFRLAQFNRLKILYLWRIECGMCINGLRVQWTDIFFFQSAATNVAVDTDDTDTEDVPRVTLAEMLDDLHIAEDATGEAGAAMME
jgi:hypothetical protein